MRICFGWREETMVWMKETRGIERGWGGGVVIDHVRE
jgi:hypothetical protein